MEKNWILTAIGFLLVLAFCIALATWTGQSNREEIKEWCEDNRCQVVSIEEPVFSYGPFWYKNDGQRIYKVAVLDYREKPRVVWFRIGWSLEAVWDD